MTEDEVLILGAGWTATFLIPLLRQQQRRFAATTTDGREVAGSLTLRYKFDPEADDAVELISRLPLARTILITFPLTTQQQVKFLVEAYSDSHKRKPQDVHFVQLGSTGIWQIEQKTLWVDRESPYDTKNARAIAEDEILRYQGSVLNLAGLWGGERDPKKWVERVAKTKDEVKSKKSLHMIHGLDVSRAFLAVHDNRHKARGQRWMLTDGFVYDWYALFLGWADQDTKTGQPSPLPSKQAVWVSEIMREENVLALPRSIEALGRAYSSRDFWDTFNLTPIKARI